MMAIQLEYLSSNLVYVVDNNNPMWSGCSKTRNQVLSFLGREELIGAASPTGDAWVSARNNPPA